jgi:hypothetical protein
MPDSAAPFCASGTGVCTNDAAIDHDVLHIGVRGEIPMHRLPNAIVAPALKPFVDAIPAPILRRKEPPLGATSYDPKHGLNELPTSISVSYINIRMCKKKRFYPFPLVIRELAGHLRPSCSEKCLFR